MLACAYAIDWIAGDPEWFPHPVRAIGRLIAGGERLVRPGRRSPTRDFWLGAVVTALVVGSTTAAALALLYAARRIDQRLAWIVEVLLAWTVLATASLLSEALRVVEALERGDIASARARLARIVGRDTASLDESEIARGVIETLAESTCDGIVAPLCFLVAGGVPAALAYKAVNTLDSMIGHRDHPYTYFGRVAARLDDVANFIPARLSALAIAAGGRRRAARTRVVRCASGGATVRITTARTPDIPKRRWRARWRVRLGGHELLRRRSVGETRDRRRRPDADCRGGTRGVPDRRGRVARQRSSLRRRWWCGVARRDASRTRRRCRCRGARVRCACRRADRLQREHQPARPAAIGDGAAAARRRRMPRCWRAIPIRRIRSCASALATQRERAGGVSRDRERVGGVVESRRSDSIRPAVCLLPTPAFSEQAQALDVAGCAIERFPLRAGRWISSRRGCVLPGDRGHIGPICAC